MDTHAISASVSEVQFSNAFSPSTVVMLEGRTIFLSEVQPPNTLRPSFVTDDGITISLSEVQPLNAKFSIEVTVDGKVTLVIFFMSLNMLWVILVMPSGITISPAMSALYAKVKLPVELTLPIRLFTVSILKEPQ